MCKSTLLKDSSEISIVDISNGSPVVLLLVSDIGWPLRGLIGYHTGPSIGIHLILGRPHGSKVIYTDFVDSRLKYKIVVPLEGSGPNFSLPPSGT